MQQGIVMLIIMRFILTGIKLWQNIIQKAYIRGPKVQ